MIDGQHDSLSDRISLLPRWCAKRAKKFMGQQCDSHSLGDVWSPWQPCSQRGQCRELCMRWKKSSQMGNAVTNECWGARVTARSPVRLNGKDKEYGLGFSDTFLGFAHFFFCRIKKDKNGVWLCCCSRLGNPPIIVIHRNHTGVVELDDLGTSE